MKRRRVSNFEIFLNNIFSKRKKLPVEVIELAEKLKFILEYYFEIIKTDWLVEIEENESISKKFDNTISIYVDPYDLGGDVKIIGLYPNTEKQTLMFVYIPRKLTDMENVQEFLENIMEKNSNERIEYLKAGNRFWINFDKIQNVMNEITIENFDFFLDMKKYNI